MFFSIFVTSHIFHYFPLECVSCFRKNKTFLASTWVFIYWVLWLIVKFFSVESQNNEEIILTETIYSISEINFFSYFAFIFHLFLFLILIISTDCYFCILWIRWRHSQNLNRHNSESWKYFILFFILYILIISFNFSLAILTFFTGQMTFRYFHIYELF